jgi:DNA modification methylase
MSRRAAQTDPAHPERIPLEALQALDGNPRRGDVAAIARSLAAFGQTKPIVANRRTGQVLAGNHTAEAARSLGWDTIVVAWVDMDPATAAAYALADNRTAELGSYDTAALAAMIAAVDAAEDEALTAATAWTPEDLAGILADGDARREGQTPLDHLPEAGPRRTAPGEIWTAGDHVVAVGDATDPGLVTEALAGAEIDCLWTDPPYGIDYVEVATSGHDLAVPVHVAGDDLEPGDLGKLITAALEAAGPHMRPGAPFYLMAAHLLTAAQAALDAGYQPRHHLVWVKDRPAFGRADYGYAHESIIWGAADEPPPGADAASIWYGWADGGAHPWFGGHTRTSVFYWPKPHRNEHHPTQKPVEVIAAMLANSTRPGALIYDPFAGSGSTLLAAATLSRRATVVELEPGHADTILTRFEEWAGTEAERRR